MPATPTITTPGTTLYHAFLLVLALMALSGCTETRLAAHVIKSVDDAMPSDGDGDFKVGKPYTIAGKTYHPRERYNYTQTGVASWYGHKFHGKDTANGERFSRFELTAAHKTLQLPSLVQVTNLENGRSLAVRVNDRGPFKRGRIIDLSERAAALLGFKKQGTARVRIDVLEQPSRRIANAAKRGESTKGAAIAANKALQSGQSPGQQTTQTGPKQAYKKEKKSEPTQLAKSRAQPKTRTRESRYERPDRAVRQQRLNQPEDPELPVTLSQPQAQDQRRPRQDDVVRETADVPTTDTDELVSKQDVAPTALYVQAGSFTRQTNARQLANKLRRVAKTNVSGAQVDGQRFYRVRLGPLENVERADEVLNRVIALGHNNAMIVVDEKEQT